MEVDRQMRAVARNRLPRPRTPCDARSSTRRPGAMARNFVYVLATTWVDVRHDVIVNACDVGMAVLQDNPTFRTVYPNKVFDYMACERATLLAIDGIARKLVCDEARAGVFAKPEDGRAIADALRKLADDPAARAEMGKRGRRWVLANATREGLAKRYLEAMGRVVGGGVKVEQRARAERVTFGDARG